MNASSPLVHPASAPEVRNVNNPVRPTKLTTRPAAPIQASTVRLKPTKQTRHRIPAPQRIRVMQKYALGQNQTAIARDENLNRETVAKIVRSAEMDAYVEEKRELWRGLCDPAIEVIRQKLKEGDKDVALRVLQSNGVIPAPGTMFNIQPATKPTGDERVRQLMEAFAAVAIERARVFKTPFPELAEIAEQHNIEVGLDLRGASDDAAEGEDYEI
jgi:hypothetical protein